MATTETLDINLGDGGAGKEDAGPSYYAMDDKDFEAALLADAPTDEPVEQPAEPQVEQVVNEQGEVAQTSEPTAPETSEPKAEDKTEKRTVPLEELLRERKERQQAQLERDQYLAYLQQQVAQQQAKQDQPQQPQEEIDPWLDPNKWLEVNQQKTIAPVVQQVQTQQYVHKAAVSEYLLQGQDKEEYQKLVKLPGVNPANGLPIAPPPQDDPGRAMFDYVQRNPQAAQDILNHPLPAVRALQIARDLQVSSPEARQKAVEAELEKRIGEEVAKALAKLQQPPASTGRPKSIAHVAGQAPTPPASKAYHLMDDDEFEKALLDPDA